MLALMFYFFIYYTPKPIKSWILKKQHPHIQNKEKGSLFFSCLAFHCRVEQKTGKKTNSKYDLINLEPFVFF